jgi:pSer/pThr/pTyr-binding forkhead associated (FHA) protein
VQESYGKLIMGQPGLPEREFELGKASVTLGRATTNDIMLDDVRVSRAHARLECGPGGCEIVDLGSSNGTRLNGLPVKRARLAAGDVVSIGGIDLRYRPGTIPEQVGMTVMDSMADVELSMAYELLPMQVAETGVTRLVVFTGDKTWEVPLDGADLISIGRADDNQVALPQTKVSRRHAELVRRGDAFSLRDLGSTNGTWQRGQRVTEVTLHDGDAFRIGDARLVFKSALRQEALTMIDQMVALPARRRPVVFVPGLFGSQLWLGSERVWPAVKILFTNPEVFLYPSSLPLEARGIVDEVVIVPNLIKQDQYNRLGDYFVQELGYERGKDFFEFAYDWRQDVRISARQLGQMIESLSTSQRVVLIGHSLGSLVARYYLERLKGNRHVERLVVMGGPHTGTAKVLANLLAPPRMLPFGMMGETLRRIVSTFPTSYQIIPTFACGVNQTGRPINFLDDERWVEEKHVPLLRAAREFRRELGLKSSVPALSIFGYGIKTISSVSVQEADNGSWTHITFAAEPSGDSSVPQQSAVLPDSEIHPVQQYHGTLFTDNDVKMRLKLELARKEE